MTSIALIANSKISNDTLLKPLILQHEKIIAVDGGLTHCERMGITPDLIVGDLDSALGGTLARFPETPLRIFPKEKDHSDLELAIFDSLRFNPVKISLFGALENRIDHTLSNLLILTRYPGRILIESDYETVHCLSGSQEFACHPGQQISLIPLPSPCFGVTTKGLKWDLKDRQLDASFFSLSNVALEESFSVDIQEGILLCCLSRD